MQRGALRKKTKSKSKMAAAATACTATKSFIKKRAAASAVCNSFDKEIRASKEKSFPPKRSRTRKMKNTTFFSAKNYFEVLVQNDVQSVPPPCQTLSPKANAETGIFNRRKSTYESR